MCLLVQMTVLKVCQAHEWLCRSRAGFDGSHFAQLFMHASLELYNTSYSLAMLSNY